MRRLLLVLALVCLPASAGVYASSPPMTLTQQEVDWIAAHPVLRVGVFEDLLPFEYMSGGQLRGLSAKYLRLIGLRTGLHFEPVLTTTRSARKEMLISGEVDILSTRRRSDDPAQDRGMLYTLPYNTSSTILVSRFGDQPLANLEQLAHKRLAMLGREVYGAFLREEAPGVTLIAAQNAVDMMAMVKDGKADAAIASEWLLIPYLSRQYQGVLQISGVVPQLHTGVSMAVRDSDEILLSILEKALASITGDERKAIFDAWFADMNLDIPTIRSIAEHYAGELWLLLAIVLLLITLVWQSRVQRRRVVQREREKAMFLAVMSHEVRSPMNAVLAAVELLEHTPLDEQQRHFTDLANTGANTLLRLVDDVLDISKMEAGQLQLNLEPVDLWSLLQQQVDDYRVYAEEKGLTLTLTGQRPVASALVDDQRVAQVLRNLISNAIKFTEHGRVEVQLLSPDTQPGASSDVLMRVVDTGIGLSDQAQAALFRPYARARQSFKRSGGTGLGLVICRRLVKLMHGELTLSSVPGSGTQVEVRLPAEWAGALEPPVRAADPDAASREVSLWVLVSGGEYTDQQAVQALLRGFGLGVRLAAKGDETLALFNQHRVDLVLIDEHQAFNLSGPMRDVERQQQRGHCPIIAMSQVTGNDYLERCFEAGLDGVLSKPVRQDKLQQMIELWCDQVLIPAAQVHSASGQEREGRQEALRQDLNRLFSAVALRDRPVALQAAHRLKGAAQTVGWTAIAAGAEGIESLLRDEVNWPTVAVADQLNLMAQDWAAAVY
ncbi:MULTISPECIES: ATP-binding protein [unclassified Pseudomonas]|uniref:ATP-binding protein n=1 Tax=unclassified Pseudomonas TaxID=196821 RepID=UPI0009194436|nr:MULTISPECIES: ATP-binding protein [unclassified Pseudomonas]OKO50073.1 histidine kinase [Pseudomonas sp. BTN1]SFY40412.1 two-component system, NarL family, sensor histidine kinase EvgS [Pseudomonas sp. NFR02]